MNVSRHDLVGSAVAGGFVGTLVLTTIIRAASEMGLTRMDLPFLLGTSRHRQPAQGEGHRLRVALCSSACSSRSLYVRSSRSSAAAPGGWVRSLGALHALFIATVLVNVLLPVVHPRMATPDTAANEIALIEPPGFLMLNYGRNTFLVTLARAHRVRRDRRCDRLGVGSWYWSFVRVHRVFAPCICVRTRL